MANRVRPYAAMAFQNIGPQNPLYKLAETDRDYLYSALTAYLLAISSDGGLHDMSSLEAMSKIALEAASLGTRLENEVFGDPDYDLYKPFLGQFSDLPQQLSTFSQRLRDLLDQVGKPGHKKRNFKNLWLVVASEFVHLKTGQHYDEHLAALYQEVANAPIEEDTSADAIRKKRVYLQKNYPELHKLAQRLALRASESSSARPS
jgi:hypothetical protein